MNTTVCEDQVAVPARHQLTVAEYQSMGECGVFSEDERIELIDGELIDMAPIGSRHAYTVSLLNRLFVKQAAENRLVNIQNPIQLGDHSEPEPDVTVVVNRDYSQQHPQADDVLLLIEVADTSLDFDRTVKTPMYAQFSIPEFWIVDLEAKRIEVYREPLSAERSYREVALYTNGQLVAKTIPEVILAVETLWS